MQFVIFPKVYSMLREMCQYSNNLYNVALYNIRQYYFREKKFLTYESNYHECKTNYHECKTNENYGLLQAGVAQQTLKVADRSFKSFFNLIKKQKAEKRLQNLTRKRNNRVNDYIKKTARYIINYCIDKNISTIVCGYNGDFKRSINLGKITNQQFTQISFGSLREALAGFCERYGMQYIEQEESYTSKSSFFDLDEIPVYNPAHPYTNEFSGKRIKRGLYRSANGRTINADVNGACNILRKSKQNFDFEELCKGLLDSPLRIRIA